MAAAPRLNSAQRRRHVLHLPIHQGDARRRRTNAFHPCLTPRRRRSSQGSLAVPGADEDADRICALIDANAADITKVPPPAAGPRLGAAIPAADVSFAGRLLLAVLLLRLTARSSRRRDNRSS